MPTPPLSGLSEPAQRLSLVEHCKATLPGSNPGNTVLRAREGKASPGLQAFSCDAVNINHLQRGPELSIKRKKSTIRDASLEMDTEGWPTAEL